MSNQEFANQLDDKLSLLPMHKRISLIAEVFSKPIFTTSLGMEDQVLTWAIATHGKSINISTLQTGRLFPETLELIQITNQRYSIAITEFMPDESAVFEYKEHHGNNGFYNSIEARKKCCEIRKVIPLGKALEGADAWVTGLRREQSNNRNLVPMAQWDDERQLVKLNPIADWTKQDLETAVAAHEIPINPLHKRNYPSIGCEPCTRAIKPGEPERAGRWWWEQDDKQECGLHVSAIETEKIGISKQTNG